MAGFYKKWMMDQREKALDDPDFPDFMTREEMFRDLDKEYAEWLEKQKMINDSVYMDQIMCNSMDSGKLCKDPNCLQCKEYIETQTNKTVKTEADEK